MKVRIRLNGLKMIQEQEPHVLLVYKNFAAMQNISHIGLGVSALNTAKVLKAHGICADVLAAVSTVEITAYLQRDQTVTHVVISAPWIKPDEISAMLRRFPRLEFAVNCHSNVGFLQADVNGTELIRQYVDLEQGNTNFRISANSQKGTEWLRLADQCPCVYLPNLYYLDYSHVAHRPLWQGGTLCIGAFGAQRPLKNLMSAAGAAVVIANTLKAHTELWMSSGRAEGGGVTVINAIKKMLHGRPNVTLKESGWQTWPQFRDIVRHMHLLILPSYTESFNMVTADGVAEGIPSVVSDAIDWVPEYWKAPVDNTNEIARIGIHLLRDPNAAHDGLMALERHNRQGIEAWRLFLGEGVRYRAISSDPHLLG